MIKKSLVVFAVFLSIVLLQSTSITPSALVSQNNYSSYEESGVANVIPTQEKTICEDVSTDNDFSNHEIIIILKNEKSLSFPKIEDISKKIRDNTNTEIESFELLCPYSYPNIEKKYKAEVARKIILESPETEFSDLNSLIRRLRESSKLDFSSKDEFFSSDILDALKKNNEALNKYVLNREIKNYVNKLEENNSYLKEFDYSQFHIKLKVNLNTNSKKAIVHELQSIRKNKDILCACPNYYYEFATERSGNGISDLWYLNTIDYFNAQSILGALPKETVTVGVMDTGVDKTHSDLYGKVDENLSESFSNEINLPNYNDPFFDQSTHGTSVAGIIGALPNNTSGTTGICQNVNIVSLKVGCNDMVETTAVTNALDYIKQDDINIDIVNMSFQLCTLAAHGVVTMQALFEDANRQFSGYNGLFVCSASNNGVNIDLPTSNYFYAPAMLHLSNVITVAASDETNELLSSSNYGDISVDLSAPGKDIYTLKPNNSYGNFQRTSAAAPIVTGIAATIKSIHPEITPQQIKSFIIGNVNTCSNLYGMVATSGVVNFNDSVLDTLSKKFYIHYNANGGTGTSMNTTTVYYNVDKSLEANTYTLLDYRFIGWTAHRNSDNKWLYTNQSENHWYIEGTQPSGYTKFVYNDCARVAKISSQNNDIVTLYAQWEPLSLGDINLDGSVSIEDVTELQLYLAEIISLTYQQLRLADVNEDGMINISDVTALQWLIAS